MSNIERSLFNLRFSVPGFIFIILFLLINPGFLSKGALLGLSIEETQGFFTIILGFLTLISGSTLGFLISQAWWLVWDFSGAHYGGTRFRERREPYQILVNDYSINNNRNDLRTVHNYLAHIKSNEQIKLYLTRRWDSFILLGSSAFAILLGLGIGYLMRIFVFKTQLTNVSIIYHFFLNMCFIPLSLYLMLNAYYKILEEHDNMTILLIRKLGVQNQLKDIIPEQYFSQ